MINFLKKLFVFKDKEVNDEFSLLYQNIDTLEKLILKNYNNNQSWVPEGISRSFNDLKTRFHEPMRIAIVGQFSAGKSTFLNALLAKDILPTGVRPVTSKINYIKYGDSIKFEAVFKDERREFYDIQAIASLTDSRSEENIEDLDYLVLYYPLDILKEVIFVDTPGLNSASEEDTKTTQNILDSVDGIIWLTFARNAAQKSEIELIETIIKKYKEKSLCIVNKKDQLGKEELEEVLEQVKIQLGSYFNRIEAISAKQAMNSREASLKTLITDATNKFIYTLQKELAEEIVSDSATLETLWEQKGQILKKEIDRLNTKKRSEDSKLLEESNIETVLTFIRSEIKQQQESSKHFALTKGIQKIAHEVKNQNTIMIDTLLELKQIIKKYQSDTDNNLNHFFDKTIKNANLSLLNHHTDIVDEAFNAIMHGWTEFENKKKVEKIEEGFIVDDRIVDDEPYTSVNIDLEKLNEYLENEVFKQIEKYNEKLKEIKELWSEELDKNFNTLTKGLDDWSISCKKNSTYENDFHSSAYALDFQNRFVSNKFERFINPFENSIIKAKNSIVQNQKLLLTLIEDPYNNIYATRGFLIDKIRDKEFAHEKNYEPFNLPTKSKIREDLDKRFYVEKIKEDYSDKTGLFAEALAEIIHAHKEEEKVLIKEIDKEIKRYADKNAKLEKFIKKMEKA